MTDLDVSRMLPPSFVSLICSVLRTIGFTIAPEDLQLSRNDQLLQSKLMTPFINDWIRNLFGEGDDVLLLWRTFSPMSILLWFIISKRLWWSGHCLSKQYMHNTSFHKYESINVLLMQYGAMIHLLRQYRQLDRSKLSYLHNLYMYSQQFLQYTSSNLGSSRLLTNLFRFGLSCSEQHRKLENVSSLPSSNILDKENALALEEWRYHMQTTEDVVWFLEWFGRSTASSGPQLFTFQSTETNLKNELSGTAGHVDSSQTSSPRLVPSEHHQLLDVHVLRSAEVLGDIDEQVTLLLSQGVWGPETRRVADRVSAELEEDGLSFQELEMCFASEEEDIVSHGFDQVFPGKVHLHCLHDSPAVTDNDDTLVRHLQQQWRCTESLRRDTSLSRGVLSAVQSQHRHLLNKTVIIADKFCPYAASVWK